MVSFFFNLLPTFGGALRKCPLYWCSDVRGTDPLRPWLVHGTGPSGVWCIQTPQDSLKANFHQHQYFTPKRKPRPVWTGKSAVMMPVSFSGASYSNCGSIGLIRFDDLVVSQLMSYSLARRLVPFNNSMSLAILNCPGKYSEIIVIVRRLVNVLCRVVLGVWFHHWWWYTKDPWLLTE